MNSATLTLKFDAFHHVSTIPQEFDDNSTIIHNIKLKRKRQVKPVNVLQFCIFFC